MKMNYKEALDYIADSISSKKEMSKLEIFEPKTGECILLVCIKLDVPDKKYIVGFKYGSLKDKSMPDSIGIGETKDEAYEDFFQKLRGNTIVFQDNITNEIIFEVGFEKEFKKYREYKKRELTKYPSLKKYEELIKNPKNLKVKIVLVKNIYIKNIKGNTLYVIGGSEFNEFYIIYSKFCEDLEYIEIGDHVRIEYYHQSLTENIARKVEIIGKS